MVSLTGAQPGGAIEVRTVTASYTVTDQDFGKMFTNRGAGGTVTFTLPAPGPHANERLYFRNTAAGKAMIVSSAASAQLVAYNDASASSVTIPATAEGCGVDCICDGTSWIATCVGFVNTATGGAQAGPTIA